jgi:putative phosphoesterase
MDAREPGCVRIAVLSDIHGNVWALESVLADARNHRPDQFIILGDLLADGPDPMGTFRLLQTIRDATFVRGNTDRYLAALDQVVPPRSELADLIATWQWAVDQLTAEAQQFLAGLPTDVFLETDAGRILATHGVPDNDEGFVDPAETCTWMSIGWEGARLLLVGHTHAPFVLATTEGTVVNPGSVGISPQTDWRASYAILDLFAGGEVAIQHVQVDWDITAYVAAYEKSIPWNRKAEQMLNTLRQIVRHMSTDRHQRTHSPTGNSQEATDEGTDRLL